MEANYIKRRLAHGTTYSYYYEKQLTLSGIKLAFTWEYAVKKTFNFFGSQLRVAYEYP